jgi:hypothetical protein
VRASDDGDGGVAQVLLMLTLPTVLLTERAACSNPLRRAARPLEAIVLAGLAAVASMWARFGGYLGRDGEVSQPGGDE